MLFYWRLFIHHLSLFITHPLLIVKKLDLACLTIDFWAAGGGADTMVMTSIDNESERGGGMVRYVHQSQFYLFESPSILHVGFFASHKKLGFSS